MIYHPIRSLVAAGITDLLVVTGVEHIGDIVSQLRSGRDLGCQFTYKCQDEPLGIADALLLAEDFAQGGPIVVILGDNARGLEKAKNSRTISDLELRI